MTNRDISQPHDAGERLGYQSSGAALLGVEEMDVTKKGSKAGECLD